MTNYERIKNMSIEDLACFLMKVNCDYKIVCGSRFKEWLESEEENTLSEAINKCNEQLETHPKFDFSDVKVIKE